MRAGNNIILSHQPVAIQCMAVVLFIADMTAKHAPWEHLPWVEQMEERAIQLMTYPRDRLEEVRAQDAIRAALILHKRLEYAGVDFRNFDRNKFGYIYGGL